jgi:hypothetical protein
MNTLILSLHIATALIMSGATLGVYAAAYARRASRAYGAMIVSFTATAVSGVVLVFAAGGLGRFCMMMSIFTVATIIANHFYRVRSLPQAV